LDEAEKACVLVVDMIVDFVYGKFGTAYAQAIVGNIREFLRVARARGVPVIYICDAHEEGDPELRFWGEHAMRGTKGAEVIAELAPAEGDAIVYKRYYDGFHETDLAERLAEKNVATLVLTGVATDICVRCTATSGFFRGFKVIVLEDCVASIDEHSHAQGLAWMAKMLGAELLSSKKFIGRL
jgi:nicotinamidase-related amidase